MAPVSSWPRRSSATTLNTAYGANPVGMTRRARRRAPGHMPSGGNKARGATSSCHSSNASDHSSLSSGAFSLNSRNCCASSASTRRAAGRDKSATASASQLGCAGVPVGISRKSRDSSNSSVRSGSSSPARSRMKSSTIVDDSAGVSSRSWLASPGSPIPYPEAVDCMACASAITARWSWRARRARSFRSRCRHGHRAEPRERHV